MKIVNDKLTATYRTAGKCRFCGRSVRLRCGAHVFSKGHGGGRQVDIRSNLVHLGMNPMTDCPCHHANHAGKAPAEADLLACAAADNDCSQDDIRSLVMLIRRMPPIRYVDEALYRKYVEMELGHGAQKLALRELETFKHLLWRDR